MYSCISALLTSFEDYILAVLFKWNFSRWSSVNSIMDIKFVVKWFLPCFCQDHTSTPDMKYQLTQNANNDLTMLL